jgi:hypothetical protein
MNSAHHDNDFPAHALAAKQAWDLGLDIALVLYSPLLDDSSGIPAEVRRNYPLQLPLKMDAAYRAQIAAVWGEHALTMNASFDTLYVVTVPYETIGRVLVQGPSLDASIAYRQEQRQRAEEAAKAPERPQLRLV